MLPRHIHVQWVTKLFNKISSLRSRVWRVVIFMAAGDATRLLRRKISFVVYLYSGEVVFCYLL